MSLVTPRRWAMWLGEMPMPEGATDEMMWAAYDAIQAMERRDEAIEGITTFTEFRKRDKQRLKEAEEWGDLDKIETLKSIIKTEKEIINTYRSWLL